jgi:hypothetical protein
MLPVSLDCPFLLPLRYSLTFICPMSCVSYVNREKLATLGTQDTGQINVREYRRGNEKGQSRETGNIGYTRHRTNKCGLFFFISPSYSLTFICPVSCVPYVASFSGLSFCITPSVFSKMYLSCVLCTQCCQFLSINIEYTRHRTNKC